MLSSRPFLINPERLPKVQAQSSGLGEYVNTVGKEKSSIDEQNVRIDKWLWAARFYKTRSLARDMVQGGKVHYNNQRTKASRIVEVGATIKLLQGSEEKTVIIERISAQRKGAPEAQTLYRETEESIAKREKNSEDRKLNAYFSPAPDRRPDKKQRRKIIQFKSNQET